MTKNKYRINLLSKKRLFKKTLCYVSNYCIKTNVLPVFVSQNIKNTKFSGEKLKMIKQKTVLKFLKFIFK